MPESPRLQRADARLARDSILTAAVTVLGSGPMGSLERVAQVAGVHRATVYRHFPSRDELIAAVVERALSDGRSVVDRAAALHPDESAVRHLAADAMQFGSRYFFLIGTPELVSVGPDPIGLSELMRTWQEHRLLRDDVSHDWLAAAFVALAQAMLAPNLIGSLDHAQDTLASMFLRGGASPGAQ